MKSKNKFKPILLFENFLDIDRCTKYIDTIDKKIISNKSDNKNIILNNKFIEDKLVFDIDGKIEDINLNFDTNITEIIKTDFVVYKTDYHCEKIISDSYNYNYTHWEKSNKADFSLMCFLTDHMNSNIINNDLYESYGGSITFTTHKLKVTPKMGSCIVYPSDHHYSYFIDDIKLGRMVVMKTYLKSTPSFVYNRQRFYN